MRWRFEMGDDGDGSKWPKLQWAMAASVVGLG